MTPCSLWADDGWLHSLKRALTLLPHRHTVTVRCQDSPCGGMALDPTFIFKTSAFRLHTQEAGAGRQGAEGSLSSQAGSPAESDQGLTLLMSRG